MGKIIKDDREGHRTHSTPSAFIKEKDLQSFDYMVSEGRKHKIHMNWCQEVAWYFTATRINHGQRWKMRLMSQVWKWISKSLKSRNVETQAHKFSISWAVNRFQKSNKHIIYDKIEESQSWQYELKQPEFLFKGSLVGWYSHERNAVE